MSPWPPNMFLWPIRGPHLRSFFHLEAPCRVSAPLYREMEPRSPTLALSAGERLHKRLLSACVGFCSDLATCVACQCHHFTGYQERKCQHGVVIGNVPSTASFTTLFCAPRARMTMPLHVKTTQTRPSREAPGSTTSSCKALWPASSTVCTWNGAMLLANCGTRSAGALTHWICRLAFSRLMKSSNCLVWHRKRRTAFCNAVRIPFAVISLSGRFEMITSSVTVHRRPPAGLASRPCSPRFQTVRVASPVACIVKYN